MFGLFYDDGGFMAGCLGVVFWVVLCLGVSDYGGFFKAFVGVFVVMGWWLSGLIASRWRN